MVPIVPGQHTDDDDIYVYDDDDDEEDLTRMENIADIWCSMLGANCSCAMDWRPSREVL